VENERIIVVHIKELGKAGLIMLILSSHTSAALQPLDRDIFGPFKTFLKQDASRWVNTHQNRKVKRMQLGILIGEEWNRAASSNCCERF
jgi:hypothetical protein